MQTTSGLKSLPDKTKNIGFTLIELMIVIVILGVLAVTAAPKFLNLNSDAKNTTMQGLKGTIQSTVGGAYGKLTINGLENQESVNSLLYPDIFPSCSNDPGDLVKFCSFRYGYPTADYGTLPALIQGVSSVPGDDDWFLYGMSAETDKRGVKFKVLITASKNVNDVGKVKADSCYLTYKSWYQMNDGSRPPAPEIEIVRCR
ncbi:MSHA pilin protein MshA [Vibrio crassostreae]|uniref:type II secretion system protein n=1 Tax=Vibrio crassostreae TaxID=246167 RepID=UPI001042F15A|nr:type II secretion system protein [Vibrio crassostreae]TCN66903.1 MSHA pilin protein MshA [Vibrio crassostreae]CAK3852169.1 MSHA pilin protein MshA [Vibrio crassostreae]